MIAEAQRRGGICAFIDAEHSMDPAYAKKIGVNIDDLLVSQPDTGEQALEICELLIRSGALDVVAIDSVAALTPKAEIEGEMGDSHVGLQARLMSQALRKLAGTLNRTDTICLFTNQLREKIGVMFGNPETTPGGRALKFYASVRLDIRRIETLKEGVEAFGNRVRVKVVKNKVAPPFKQAEFDIIYGSGISWEGTVLDAGIDRKIVAKSGSYFSFGDERLGQGRQNATAFLREHPDVTQQILQRIQIELGPEQIVSARLLPALDADAPSTNGKKERAEAVLVAEPRAVASPLVARGADAQRTVTALRERPRGRVEVELDGVPWRLVPTEAVVRSGLFVGRALDRETARTLGRELRRADALGARAARAPARDRSRRSLDERLGAAGVAPAARKEALETLERAGLVDDDRLAAARAQALAERGYGDAAIRFDLEHQGLGARVGRGGARRARAGAAAGAAARRAARQGRAGRPAGWRRRASTPAPSRTRWGDLRKRPDRR